jgi:hypothetical protein
MRYVLAVAVIAAAVTAAGSATAAGGPPPTPSLVASLDVVFQRTDAAGNPVGAPQRFHDPQGPPSFVDEQAAKGVGKSDPDRTLAGRTRIASDGGTPSYSGCGWLHAWLTEKDILGLFVVFKYHVRRSWCWNYGHRVTSASTQTPWFTDVDPNFIIISVSLSPHGWFYTWCCGDGHSGHYAFRQGEIQNCILKYGCIGTWYPTIEIFLHGDGTWHVRRSGY